MSEEYATHPSWAMLQISRVSGQAELFGSHVKHQHFISLRIAPGQRKHDLGQDWYLSTGQPYIEVYMSAAQFAEAITSLNTGCGVPATLRWLKGEKIPQAPKEESESDRTAKHAKSQTLKADAEVLRHQARIAEILEKTTVGKSDRAEIKKLVEFIAVNVRHSIPFYLDQFTEATEKITQKAKTEFESMALHHFAQLGIKAHQAGLFLNASSDQERENSDHS